MIIACPSGAMTCAILSPSKSSMASSTASREVFCSDNQRRGRTIVQKSR